MVASERLICSSDSLVEGGEGVCFTVTRHGAETPAFAVRFEGVARAFLNQCGHVPVGLDWLPGQFFDDSKVYLICSVHGALYAPDTGRCLGGRCQGKGLTPLVVKEQDGAIYLLSE